MIDAYVDSYNKRPHRMTGLSPNEGERPHHAAQILMKNEERYAEFFAHRRQPKYKVNDIVRIKLKPGVFTRGYHWRFSPDYYKIIEIKTRQPQPMYKVENMSTAKQPKRHFYFEQLQPVTGNVYRIEKVLKEDKRNKRIFVKWMNFHRYDYIIYMPDHF